MFFEMPTQTEILNRIITEGAATALNDRQYIEAQIRKWRNSPQWKAQVNGENYYRGFHDILNSKRTAIGQNGELEEIKNLPKGWE